MMDCDVELSFIFVFEIKKNVSLVNPLIQASRE